MYQPNTITVLLLICAASFLEAEPPRTRPKSREFLFSYQALVAGLRPGQTARIWLPVPPSNAEQKVAIVHQDLPAEARVGREGRFGNQILYVETKVGQQVLVPLTIVYRVQRREIQAQGLPGRFDQEKPGEEGFLKADARVPVGGKSLSLLQGKNLPADQLGAARVLYDVVNGHMRYNKEGTGWGQGDAVWACENGFGNCTDFHSLFISLARAQKIPAKFEIGFPLPPERGLGSIAGYHCWARCKPDGQGWLPVDISEGKRHPKLKDYYFGNLSADRVAFSVGRDLVLVPPQQGPPLNYFIYPHVEVDGQPYPDSKVQRQFAFWDL